MKEVPSPHFYQVLRHRPSILSRRSSILSTRLIILWWGRVIGLLMLLAWRSPIYQPRITIPSLSMEGWDWERLTSFTLLATISYNIAFCQRQRRSAISLL